MSSSWPAPVPLFLGRTTAPKASSWVRAVLRPHPGASWSVLPTGVRSDWARLLHWTAIQEFLRHFWSSYPVTSAVLYNMVCHQQLKYIVFVVTVS